MDGPDLRQTCAASASVIVCSCFGINGCRTQLFDVKSGSAEIGQRLACLVHLAPFAPSIDLLFTDHRQTWIGIERCRRLQLARVAWSIGVIVWADGPGLSDRFFWLFSRSVEARIHTTSRSAEGKHYVFICFHRFSNQAPCHHSASLLRPQNAGVSWYGNRASNVLGLKRKE